ncbi:ninjurin-A-like [Euwallacea fornicatus]|uniref:ninjurin-A-like n=1 Tax=Euwallacea fornicatus TaxID=995702 RepID=UPI003390074C
MNANSSASSSGDKAILLRREADNNSSITGSYSNNSADIRRNTPNTHMLRTPPNNINRSRSPSPSKPLLSGTDSQGAPLARIETDEEVDDREVVNRPYPGVDDGFFSNGDNEEKPNESGNPEVEFVPTRPKDPEDVEPHVPSITPRAGADAGGVQPDEPQPPAEVPKPPSHRPEFPQSPGFRPWGYDLEFGSSPTTESIPDLNVYQHKKTLAQGMMDLALFSANANQLRYVLETFRNHPYYYPSLVLISISLFLQVAVGIGLIWNATYNIKDEKSLCVANKVNNATTICVFLVTIINVFISAFGVAPAPS